MRKTFFLVLLILIYVPVFLFSEQLPTWNLSNLGLYNPIPAGFPFAVSINRSAVLVLDTESTDLDEYYEEKREFKRKFEEELEKKKNEFHQKSGKSRIDAGYALLVYIAESWVKWRTLQMPPSGTWKGLYKVMINVGDFATADVEADMVLTLENIATDVEQRFLYSDAKGQTQNGTSSVDLNMGALLPYVTGGAVGEHIWEGVFKGSAMGTKIVAEHTITDMQGDTIIGFSMMDIMAVSGHYRTEGDNLTGTLQVWSPVAYATATTSGGSITGEVIVYDPLLGIYRVEPINESTGSSCSNKPETLLFTASGLNDDLIDFQKILDDLYKEYVDAVERYNNLQFNGAGNLEDKEKRARENLLRLYTVLSEGQMLGVLDSAIAASGLRQNDPSSLFDRWFEKWFTTGDKICLDKIHTAGSEENLISSHYSRFKYYVQGAMEITFGICSDQLARELHLVLTNNYVDDIYLDYFEVMRIVMCTDFNAGRINQAEISEWKSREIRQVFGAVSDSVINTILTSDCNIIIP